MKTKNTILISLLLSLSTVGCNNGSTQQSNILSNTNVTPSPEYNHILSPNGPNVSLDELEKLKNQNSNTSLKAGKDTYTYVRCYYAKNSIKSIDTTITNPDTDYIWAKNADSSDYKLYGYWNTDGITEWMNMFFTSTKLAEIQDICNKTLISWSNGKFNYSFYQVAADNRYSFNQTIWQNNADNDTGIIADKIVSFGDSITDTNNIYNASAWVMPNKSSWFQGRFTNGYTWVEYLSRKMEIPVYNWAVGGSEGTKKYVLLSGLNDQVQSWHNYMQSAKNYNVKRTLFTILIGGNDFVNDDRNPSDVINDVRTALITLGQQEAKNVLLMNLPDVTKSPVFHMSKDPSTVYQKIIDYNNQLITLTEEINARFPKMNVMLFDTKSQLDKVIANSAAYGFTNTYDSCLNINTDSAINYTNPQSPRSSCADASKFVFWDTLHPTTATHKALAEEVFPFVTQNFKTN